MQNSSDHASSQADDAFTFGDTDADLEALARFLDARFSIFGIKFGFDSLIGLIPGIGDAASAAIGIYIIFRAWREGASFFIILRMFWTWLLDLIFGAVPVFGDIFDIAFRSNLKNVRLLQRHLKKREQRQARLT